MGVGDIQDEDDLILWAAVVIPHSPRFGNLAYGGKTVFLQVVIGFTGAYKVDEETE
jgi:hypothetical protein